jgi:hypothetical protein
VVRDPVARMRGDPPQGHVAAYSDARQEWCSQEAQANTTFEISGLVPRYGRVQRAATRSAPKLLVPWSSSATPPRARRISGFSARGPATVAQPRVNDLWVATKRLPAHGGGLEVQLGAAPGVFPLRLSADQSLLAGAGPQSRGFF